MKIGQTLLYLRNDRQLSQNYMAENLMPSTSYSKIERDLQAISFNILLKLLDKLGVTIEEFLSLASNDASNTDIFLRDELKKLLTDVKKNKKRILKIYTICQNKKDETVEYYSIYLLLQTLLSTTLDSIQPVSEEDKLVIKQRLEERFFSTSFISYYDYRILSNIIVLYSTEDIDSILEKVFPVKLINKRNFETYKMIRLTYNNAISIFIMNHDLKNANKYLQSAFHFEKEAPNQHFKSLLLYYYNIYLFLAEPTSSEQKETFKNEALYYLDIQKNLGYLDLYNQMKIEFDKVIIDSFTQTGDDFMVQISSES
ncbi:helix-turn-helix domain-containing protein [Carnobacterium maltaromaticum]|uniref:helix-turn-helix domain-containing protein n=1 Tax=Carnobacterium maltaromaticum TaxID=2751 RepID=UPI00191BC20B|nr:helix-turn-helix transcriptional regulator [Carnobacterium maltaromaticum]CAD5903219.1 hypothetical protein CMALT394_690012 [Carnobacterium maltaromaticum]